MGPSVTLGTPVTRQNGRKPHPRACTSLILTGKTLSPGTPKAIQPMRYVLWIGGPPASGKTTIARRLARKYGLRLYSADTRTWDHRDRAIAGGHAAAIRWESLTPAQRWEQSTPEEMLAMSLHTERGPMVIADLRTLPDAPLIVAEGSVLPASASAGIAGPSRAVWLLPTAAFQDRYLAERRVTGGPAALYRLQRDVIEREAREHAVTILTVDGSRDIAQMAGRVEDLFRDALLAGPHAKTLAARRGLLRAINTDLVAQVRGYYARPWATGDADSVPRLFVCECGATACDLEVELTVGSAAANPVLAAGHRS